MFYVYEHWRLDRDECFYVGKGRAGRAYKMSNRNRHHQAICAKVTREGFAIEVKIVSCGLSERESFDLEIKRIAFWRDIGVDLANATLGGDGVTGLTHSDKSKEKMSSAKRGRVLSEETRKNMSISQMAISEKKSSKIKELWKSEEYRKRMSDAHKGKTLSASARAKVGAASRGKPRSEETKIKVSKGLMGHSVSDESRARMSAAQRGSVHSDETKRKRSEAMKEIWKRRKAPSP